MQIQLHKILDVTKCYEILRYVRCNSQVICTKCKSWEVI